MLPTSIRVRTTFTKTMTSGSRSFKASNKSAPPLPVRYLPYSSLKLFDVAALGRTDNGLDRSIAYGGMPKVTNKLSHFQINQIVTHHALMSIDIWLGKELSLASNSSSLSLSDVGDGDFALGSRFVVNSSASRLLLFPSFHTPHFTMRVLPLLAGLAFAGFAAAKSTAGSISVMIEYASST